MQINGIESLIIADDEWRQAANTLAEVSEVLDKRKITVVTGGLVELLTIIARTQPQVVMLDNRYAENRDQWVLDNKALSTIEAEWNKSVEPIQKPDRGRGVSMSGVMPDDLYHPNATHFALLLRFVGYQNATIAVSNDPPKFEYIDREKLSLNDHLGRMGTEQISIEPVNGILMKNNDFPYKIWQSNNNGQWNEHFEEVAYRAAITQLLEELEI